LRRIAGPTFGRPLRTFETVAIETPTDVAMSFTVTHLTAFTPPLPLLERCMI